LCANLEDHAILSIGVYDLGTYIHFTLWKLVLPIKGILGLV
jgi:hypothetical protein